MDEIEEFDDEMIEECVYYNNKDDASSDDIELYAPEIIDDAIEKLIEDNVEIRYNLFFLDETSPYQSLFRQYYNNDDPEEDMLDLTGVVATVDAKFIESTSSNRENNSKGVEQFTTPALVHEGIPLKHTKGSFFLKDNYSYAILIPVADTVNRAQLIEQHGHLSALSALHEETSQSTAEELKNVDNISENVKMNYGNETSGDAAATTTTTTTTTITATENNKEATTEILDFRVGYNDGVATGWALPVTTDKNILSELKKLYPEYRSATLDDMWMFMRVFDPNEHASYLRRRARENDNRLYDQMTNWQSVKSCVDDAGGWRHVEFVVFDVVTAMIAPSETHILPLEMCFLPLPTCCINKCHCDNSDCCKKLVNEASQVDQHTDHFFLHPGLIKDKWNVYDRCLSKHGIPCSNMTFLKKNYMKLAEDIMRRYINKRNVIFICTSDPKRMSLPMYTHAIRWLFAAANAINENEKRRNDLTNNEDITKNNSKADDESEVCALTKNITVPSIWQIRCFDYDAVMSAIEHEFDIKVTESSNELITSNHELHTENSSHFAENNKEKDREEPHKKPELEEQEEEQEQQQQQHHEEEQHNKSSTHAEQIGGTISRGEACEECEDNESNNCDVVDVHMKCWYHKEMASMCDNARIRCALEEAQKIRDKLIKNMLMYKVNVDNE